MATSSSTTTSAATSPRAPPQGGSAALELTRPPPREPHGPPAGNPAPGGQPNPWHRQELRLRAGAVGRLPRPRDRLARPVQGQQVRPAPLSRRGHPGVLTAEP